MSLIDDVQDQEATLAALNAHELDLTEGADSAIQALLPLKDPIRTHAALKILIRAKRIDDAAELIRHRKPEIKWVSSAAYIFAFRGEWEFALEFVEHADRQSDLLIMRTTRIACVEGLIDRWRESNQGASLFNVRWNSDDQESSYEALRLLDPIIALVEANRRICSEIELYGIQYAIQLCHVARRTERLHEFVQWLLQYSPVTLFLAELALCGVIHCPEGLASRLRTEHPDSFQAAFLSALIERELSNRPEDAFATLMSLRDKASSDSEKESVCIGLFEAAGSCSPTRFDEAIAVVESLRPNDARLTNLLKSIQLMQEGSIDNARERLESVRDEEDGVWWQVHAHLCQLEGNDDEAEASWHKAGDLLPHRDVISRSIQASIDRRRFENAIRGLRVLIDRAPNDEKNLTTISWAYVQLGDNASAIPHLQQLVAISPTNLEYRIHLAQCLARSARIPEAIDHLRIVCESEECPTEATFLLSELLGHNNEPGEAFDLIDSVSADHWDDPVFVMLFMKRAHAASEEPRANEAMARLIELRQQGKVPDELMRPMTLEQVLKFGDEYESNRKMLQEAVISGRMPWLFVESLANNPAVWAWRLHTQELKWNSEERLSRAAFSIYATNGFTPVKGKNEKVRLEPIWASDQETCIVVDLTALVTLHGLECLETVAKSVGRLILPASYGDLRHRDSDRLSAHQPAIRTALLRIQQAIDQGHLSIRDETGSAYQLDQYSDDPLENRIMITDIADSLESLQKCSDKSLNQLRSHGKNRCDTSDAKRELRVGSDIQVDLFTLRSLAECDAFDEILRSFQIFINSGERDRVIQDLRAYENLDHANDSHRKLWDLVADLEKRGLVEWSAISRKPGSSDDDEDIDADVLYLHSLRLSEKLGVPLLADDRVLQVIAFQQSGSGNSSAFDSQQILMSLHRKGVIESREIAEHLNRLIRWRYRFLTPSASVLFTWAKDGKNSLPGNSLLDAALYLHDCLRDPALHCGLESTDPPMPIALRVVTSWTEAIVELLSMVWDDQEFEEQNAVALTIWAATEFLPSCPRGLCWQPLGINIAKNQPRSTIKMAQIQFVRVRNQKRANLGLRTLADGLGLDDDEFISEVVEGLNVAKLG